MMPETGLFGEGQLASHVPEPLGKKKLGRHYDRHVMPQTRCSVAAGCDVDYRQNYQAAHADCAIWCTPNNLLLQLAGTLLQSLMLQYPTAITCCRRWLLPRPQEMRIDAAGGNKDDRCKDTEATCLVHAFALMLIPAAVPKLVSVLLQEDMWLTGTLTLRHLLTSEAYQS